MSRGAYDSNSDQPPSGWPNHEQVLWMHPHLDGLDDFYERYPYLLWGALPNVGARGTRPPDRDLRGGVTVTREPESPVGNPSSLGAGGSGSHTLDVREPDARSASGSP